MATNIKYMKVKFESTVWRSMAIDGGRWSFVDRSAFGFWSVCLWAATVTKTVQGMPTLISETIRDMPTSPRHRPPKPFYGKSGRRKVSIATRKTSLREIVGGDAPCNLCNQPETCLWVFSAPLPRASSFVRYWAQMLEYAYLTPLTIPI